MIKFATADIFETKKDEDVPKKLLQPVIDAAKW